MTFEIAFVIIVVLVAFVLFVTEAFSLDVTALLVLSVLFIGGLLKTSTDERKFLSIGSRKK